MSVPHREFLNRWYGRSIRGVAERRPASEQLVENAWRQVRDQGREAPARQLPPEPKRPPTPAKRPEIPAPDYPPPRPLATAPHPQTRDSRPQRSETPDVARTLIRLVRFGIVAFILLSVVGGFLGVVTRDSGEFQDVVVTTERSGAISEDTVLDSDQNGGFSVAADDVTVDCNGFSIAGTGDGSGILITDRTGVRVINCRVLNFEAGIHMVGGSGNTIDSTTVSGSVVGMVLAQTAGNTVSNSAFNANGSGVIITSGSSGNSFIGSEASGNGSDGFLSLEDAGPDNLFLSNTAERNRGFGFLDASPHAPEGRYESNLCDANNRVSSPEGLCSLAG